jgi:hypothetical protein
MLPEVYQPTWPRLWRQTRASAWILLGIGSLVLLVLLYRFAAAIYFTTD